MLFIWNAIFYRKSRNSNGPRVYNWFLGQGLGFRGLKCKEGFSEVG